MTNSRRGSRHAFLRDATAAVHENLEAVIEGRAYLRAPASYGQYLQRLHAFHLEFLDAMRRRCKDLAETWELEDHGVWLSQDLEDLCLQPIAADTRASEAPRITDRASAFGAAYVLFGSALGARILLKQAQALPLPEGRGLTYLASLARETGWPKFLASLESEPDLSERELLRGALETFQSFKGHMIRSIVP